MMVFRRVVFPFIVVGFLFGSIPATLRVVPPHLGQVVAVGQLMFAYYLVVLVAWGFYADRG